MAATATRSKTSKKSEPAPKKKREAETEPRGPELEIRYPRVMKPNRVYPLAVVVPKRPKDSDAAEPSGLIVVRPIVPGALVTPSEQRLELAPGHQVLFHLTPLARGRLPRVRLDVFVANQPTEPIPLAMKSKTQRLALCLLALAVLMPIFIDKITTGNWAPRRSTVYNAVHKELSSNLPPVPLFNRDLEFLGETGKGYNAANYVAVGLDFVHKEIDSAAKSYPWFPNAFILIFGILAVVAWAFHTPRAKSIRHTLHYNPGEASEGRGGAPVVLEPI